MIDHFIRPSLYLFPMYLAITKLHERWTLTNSVYLPRGRRPALPLAYPRQINLVGLKRLDSGTYGDCKRPAPRVKPRQGRDGLARRRRAACCWSEGVTATNRALWQRENNVGIVSSGLCRRGLSWRPALRLSTAKSPSPSAGCFHGGLRTDALCGVAGRRERNRRRRQGPSRGAVGTARPLRATDALPEVLHRRRDHRIGLRYRQGLPCQG
jgi:hypothetical protein